MSPVIMWPHTGLISSWKEISAVYQEHFYISGWEVDSSRQNGMNQSRRLGMSEVKSCIGSWSHQNYYSKVRGDLKKSLKFQLLAKIFSTPSPPLWKRALPTKTWYFEPYYNYKVLFFSTFQTPSPISSESQTSTTLSIEVAPKSAYPKKW